MCISYDETNLKMLQFDLLTMTKMWDLHSGKVKVNKRINITLSESIYTQNFF